APLRGALASGTPGATTSLYVPWQRALLRIEFGGARGAGGRRWWSRFARNASAQPSPPLAETLREFAQ
ncbi:MAG: hypothetical protein ABI854_03645, partial [Betaproteobacteria bacterium]